MRRHLILSLFLLLFASSVSAQTFTFDVRDATTSTVYHVTVNLSSKQVTVGNVFNRTFHQVKAFDNGVAFTFSQREEPTLKSNTKDWYFCIKPDKIGFYNPNTIFFGNTNAVNPSAFTQSYNSLVAAVNGGGNKPSQPVAQQPSSGSNRTFTVNGVSFTMVYVAGGTFTMGATSEQGSDVWDIEKPSHRVTLSSYHIGQTEVTQELWQAVMGNNPSWFKGSQRPVECVSWDDCQAFISKLNNITGQRFRLPTEAEWEFAARGGNSSRGYKYAGSNILGSVAWYYENSGDKYLTDSNWSQDNYKNNNCRTHDVATKSPNELGIYDMSGNVWEWCSDWYRDYSSGSQTNPQGPSSGSIRVRRGGSWENRAWRCRVAFRNGGTPDGRLYSLGLRLAF